MKSLFLFLVTIAPILASYNYTTNYIEIPIDHFNFVSNATFKLKYLVNDTYYADRGPIFFYTGNEGEIETFAQNTGFLNEIAPQFNALIVFAEHRYYGESLPFGNNSYTSPQYLGYLTSSQALADFVDVIDALQAKYKPKDMKLPVIAFGGSYGGMLAAWIRMKYPASVLGSIAASAPILQFQDLTPCENFNRIVTNDYEAWGSEKCSNVIKKSWAILRSEAKSTEGKSWLSNEFKLCKALATDDDTNTLVEWIAEIYTNVAMVNYPYATSFLAPLPPNPIREVCSKINSVNYTSDRELLNAVSLGISVYTNFTGQTKCNDIGTTSENLGESGWNFQACTEMIMPMCSTDDDMFENQEWDLKKYEEDCIKQFKVGPLDPRIPILEYGGKDLKASSNIVFSNGLMDPWSSGGVLSNVSSSVYSVIIPDGAHHYDLRSSNPADTESVKEARKFHVDTIKIWLNDYYRLHLKKMLKKNKFMYKYL